MATFEISIVGTGTTTAYLSGSFIGGDPAYQNVRCVEVYLRTAGGSGRYVNVFSEESSGGDNHFYETITGLQPDTYYVWMAVLQYYDAEGWHDSSYIDHGTFRTDAPQPETYVQVWTNNGGWKKAVPWVYNDGWKRAEPWIYNGSWKGST